MEFDKLQSLYREEERQLEQKLLAGASWEELAEDRRRLGELSTIIYKRRHPAQFGNPAENASRKQS